MALFNESGKAGRHDHVEDEPDFTAMIDMTFILLAFFIVTSTMEVSSTLVLPPAQTGKGLEEKAVIITVFYDNDTPEVYLADGVKKDGPATMSEITSYVAQGVAQQRTRVLIKADRETPSGFVEEVARAAGRAEGVQGFFVAVKDNSM
ncbi:MAG: biopolymer transporter ExbD [Planctomycetaceae bacterium]